MHRDYPALRSIDSTRVRGRCRGAALVWLRETTILQSPEDVLDDVILFNALSLSSTILLEAIAPFLLLSAPHEFPRHNL